jgi:DNA polymerase-3 subunit gamma/tau
MLGLADRAVIIDLFEAALGGRPAVALDLLADLHRAGADPVVVLRDLLDLTHFLTRAKVVPAVLADPTTPEAERARGGALAGRLTVPLLTRAWQLLLKGLNEAMAAPAPHQAVEMVIIRLAYAADLPTPGDLVRQFQSRPAGGPAPAAPPSPGGGGPRAALAPAPTALTATATARAEPQPVRAEAVPSPLTATAPQDFRALVRLFADHQEGMLYAHLLGSVHLVRLEPGLLEIRPKPAAPRDLVNRVGPLLSEWTGRRWTVVANFEAPGEPTLAEQDAAAAALQRQEVESHPLVRAVLEAFPGARIDKINDTTPVVDPQPSATDGAADVTPEFSDEEGEFEL